MNGVRLTAKNNGTYGLPVVEELRTNKQVKGPGGVVYPPSIWRLFKDKELGAIGLAHVDDVTKVADGKERSSAFTDKYTNARIQRTFTLVDLDITKLKDRLLNSVKGWREQKINAGIEVTISSTKYILQTDEVSRGLLTGATAAANANHTFPAGFSWRMRDNTDVGLNHGQMKALGGDVFDHVNACHEAAREHATAIYALSSYADIKNYDMDTLWPPVADPE